jgi:titin
MQFSNIGKSYLNKITPASIFIITLMLFFNANAPVFAITTVPGSPTGLTSVAVSPTQVNLFWTAPSSDGGSAITGYKIEYKTGSFYSTLVENTGVVITYQHTGLATGTAYTYKISAVNPIGTSAASSEASATPKLDSTATAPGTPTGVTATAVSPTRIDLSWTAPSNNGGYPITGYKIQYRIGSDSYTDLVGDTKSTATTFSHTGISAGKMYLYQVYAITSFATSAKPSTPEAFVSLPSAATAPDMPTGLAAIATSPTKIDLSWTAPSNKGGYPVTGYKIEYKKGTGTYLSLVANTANTTTSYSHTGLATGTAYTYKISAINSIGIGAASTEAAATPTTASVAAAPSSPTGLTATAVSATQINLSWGAPSNGGSAITGYKIEYKTGSGSYSVLVPNTASTSTTYSHTGLATGTAYTYKISAINSIGTSAASSETSATPATTSQPSAATAPSSPTGLTATAVSATQINLSWGAPSNGGSAITGYKIEVKKGTGSYETLVPNTASTSTTYSHTGLATGTVYYYRISAINSIGTGMSSDASATPKETTTPFLTAIAISPTQISLSWTEPSQTYQQRITGYKIEEKIGDGKFKTINDNIGSTTTYLVNGLTTGKSHTYAVSAVFGLGASPRSNDASATPTSVSVPPAGYSTAPPPQTTKTSSDPNASVKSQQDDFQKKVEQAREDLKKIPGKEDSEKAKAVREEAKKANEKARQDALAAKRKAIADKQASLKADQGKTTDQIVQENKKTSKQLHDEAVKLRELEKQAKKQ